jgi:hypothetical protein
MPKAMLAAAIFGLLFLLFNYVLVKAARTHATIARTWLASPAADTAGNGCHDAGANRGGKSSGYIR